NDLTTFIYGFPGMVDERVAVRRPAVLSVKQHLYSEFFAKEVGEFGTVRCTRHLQYRITCSGISLDDVAELDNPALVFLPLVDPVIHIPQRNRAEFIAVFADGI